tara:strand:- start:523 stop:6357 length:5835 start_codon:yes stop_codon:yes gene_type:complete
MNEKNGFLYNVINLFEQGDRALRHNNYGAHIWTPELQEKYGATKGDPFTGSDGRIYHTAFYDNPDTGKQASNYVIDNIWDNSKGDSLKFVTQYTGLPATDPTVQNYVQAINKQKNQQNLEGALQRLENRNNLVKQKEELYSEFPEQEKKIDKLIDTGLYSADGIRDQLNKVTTAVKTFDYDQFKSDVMTSLDISQDEVEGLKNAFIRGYGNLKTMTNVIGYQLGVSPEDRIKQIAIEQSGLEGLPASESFERAMNPNNDFGQTLKEIGADPIAVTTQLAVESLVQFLPVGLAVGLPLGIATAIVGAPAWLPIATAGGIASLGIEWSSEILNSFSQQGVNVKDPDELASAFTNEEINSKAQQEALEKGVPVAVFDAISGGIAGRTIKMARGLGLTKNLTAVGKEILQQAGLGGAGEALGQAVALDPEEGEQFNIPAIVAESVVEIGTGAVSGTIRLTFDNGNTIEVDESDPLVQDIITAKTKQYQEPTTDVEAEYAGRVSQLSNYKDKIGIGFSEAPIEDVKTEQELIDLGYNPSQFETDLIKEGENEYVNDGVNRYRVTVQATNYEFGDGTRRVLLSKDATQSDFLEDTAEAVLSRLPENNEELRANIDRWIAGVENEALAREESLQYSGEELFSKSFLKSLGYDVTLPSYAVLPDNLLTPFKEELVLDDGTNLIDGFEISQEVPSTPVEEIEVDKSVVSETPTKVEKAPKEEMFSFGNPTQQGVFVMGGDAIARDVKGERSVEGIRYPEKHSGWQLSEGGATALENQAKAGNDVIVVYQYPSQTATESNPRFKEVFEREKKKNAKRKKGNKKTLIQLRKDVERMVSEPDVNLTRGKVLYVAQFDKVLRGDNRTVKHDTYPAQIVFKNVKELTRPFNIQTLTDSVDPAISRNAETFVSSRDLRSRSANLYLAPSESPMVQELRAFAEGKKSVFDPRSDSDKVMATYRRKGETTVKGVFNEINSERELQYVGTLSDVAKDINLNGRHTQAGAVTNDFGKENSMVFTVENPDQNALDLYIAYAGLLGNQFSVMHFKPDVNGKDSVHMNVDTFNTMDEVRQLSEQYFEKGIDHTVEIRGNKAQFILIDPNNENYLNFQKKGVIDDNTRTTKGSITFRESQDSKLYDTSTPEKERRKLARDYWQSEIERLQKLGYTSESGQESYSNLKSKLNRGEGFSLSPAQEKEYAKQFNKKVTSRERKNANRDAKINSPKQNRDYFRTFSSQLNRINPKITEKVRKFQKNHADILKEYVDATAPFGKTLKRIKKKARSRKAKAEYVALKLALFNGDTATVKSILKTKRRLKQYETWQTAHENLHKKAKSVGVEMGHIENHFPREVVDYNAFFEHIHKRTATGRRSKLQEAWNDAQAKRGRALTDVEKVQIANLLIRQQKGLLGSDNVDWTKSRKIDKLTIEQLKFYDEPYNSLGRYADGLSKKIAMSQFLGGRTNRYTLRVLPKSENIRGVGIYDNRIQRFLLNEQNGIIVYRSKTDPNAIKALQVLTEDEQASVGMPYLGLEDQVGDMIANIQVSIPLTRGQEARVTQLMHDYLKEDSMNSIFSTMRNVGYISTMGSVFSAITQLGDLGVAVYREGRGKTLGLIRPSTYTKVVAEMFKSLTRLNKYKLKQLGVDNRILQELNDNQTSLQRAMIWVFRLSGLSTMDRVGKETYVNTVMKKYEKGAKQAIRGRNNKLTRDFKRRINRKFNKAEANQVINDLSQRKTTELTELLAYSELLDVQPVAKSEVPVGYMRHPNGRIFYMLKTFMLKRFDVFVNETNMLKKEGKHASAIMNMVMLGTVLAMAEASADTIKDWMAGRKTPINELVWANLLKLAGMSRYHYYNFINSKPSQAIIKMIVPPFDYVDDPWMDYKFLKGRLEKYKNTKDPARLAYRDFEKRGARWIKHIPVIGKHLYWMDKDGNWAKFFDRYAPLMSKYSGYGKRAMEERLKKERNK